MPVENALNMERLIVPGPVYGLGMAKYRKMIAAVN